MFGTACSPTRRPTTITLHRKFNCKKKKYGKMIGKKVSSGRVNYSKLVKNIP
jgi:hypothetical protein